VRFQRGDADEPSGARGLGYAGAQPVDDSPCEDAYAMKPAFTIVLPTGLERIGKSFYFTAAVQFLTNAGLMVERNGRALPVRKEGKRLEAELESEDDADLAMVAIVGFDLWERYERFYRDWKDSGGEVTQDDLTAIEELGAMIEQSRGGLSLPVDEVMQLGKLVAAGLAWSILESEGYHAVLEPRVDGHGNSVGLRPRLRLVRS
jgi:hypothetical protein